jgi:hypothetical protein
MRPYNKLLVFGLVLLFAACGPKIAWFRVSSRTIGENDPDTLQWNASDSVYLKIADHSISGNTTHLLPLTLLISLDGSEKPYLLANDQEIILHVPNKDEMVIRKKADTISDERVRYLTLVAKKGKKEADTVLQIEVRPDSVQSELAVKWALNGTELYGTVNNDSARWGNAYIISSVSDPEKHIFKVMHAGMTDDKIQDGTPDYSFKGQPVSGPWELHYRMTAEQIATPSLRPKKLILKITVKHR